MQEIKNHISSTPDVRGIHGKFAEEIAHIGLDDRQSTQTIPEIIKSKKTFCAHTGTLIRQRHERAAQFDGVRHILLEELLREVEHVTRGQFGLSFLVQLPVSTLQVTISTNNLLFLWIPDDKLFIAIFTGIELINIHRLTCTASCLTEGDLAKAPDLFHHVGCIVSSYDINLVMTFVGHTKLKLRCQFTFEDFLFDWLDNLLFHLLGLLNWDRYLVL